MKLLKYDITRQETRAEKVAALATAQEKAFDCKTREKTGVIIHGQPCKFTFLWNNGAFYVNACINTTDFSKQLFTIRAKLPAFWLLNIAEKTVKQVLRQTRAGQSVEIRKTEKPQNPHTIFSRAAVEKQLFDKKDELFELFKNAINEKQTRIEDGSFEKFVSAVEKIVKQY